MGKSFKNEMQQSKPAAAKIINVGGGGDGDPEAVELKSKRLNLLLKPSIFTGLDKIRTMQRVSFNEAVNKALQDAQRKMAPVCLDKNTIPHAVEGTFGASRVKLIPARPGTGVIAGAAVRAVCEAAGIRDILTKSYGSANQTNLVKATVEALNQLRTKEQVANLRGVEL